MCSWLNSGTIYYNDSIKQRENFDQFEQKAQDKTPQVPYKDANKRQVHRKRQGNDGPAEERVLTLTGRDRF